MRLKKLLKEFPDLEVRGPKEVEIRGIALDSRCVAPGDLFVAQRGKTSDGNHFISQAVDAGAVAVLSDLPNPFFDRVTQLIAKDVRSITSHFSSLLYQEPSKELSLVGITGTNGKTTTSYLLRHFLENSGRRAGLIGTIEVLLGDEVRKESSLTTPSAPLCHKLLREMVVRGCDSCVMEVSSHSLDQKRVASLQFDLAIFTNLTPDHLDYHVNMETYGAAKRELFKLLDASSKKNKRGVFNADSPYNLFMQEGYKGDKITYGIDQDADLRATQICRDPKGTVGMISYQGKQILFKSPLIGKCNVYNLLAALAGGIALSLSLEAMLDSLSSFAAPLGRLEKVVEYKDAHVFIDFAHTEDALENVLGILSEIKKGKIIALFGCGGNRDLFKRPKMAKIAERYADITIVTSDNPRNEDPVEICQQIVQGFSSKDRYILEIDRETAIKKALSLAGKEDIVLLAGKGHEKVQIFSHKTLPFDERAIVAGFTK